MCMAKTVLYGMYAPNMNANKMPTFLNMLRYEPRMPRTLKLIKTTILLQCAMRINVRDYTVLTKFPQQTMVLAH